MTAVEYFGDQQYVPFCFATGPLGGPVPVQRICAGHSPEHGVSPPETRRIPPRGRRPQGGATRAFFFFLSLTRTIVQLPARGQARLLPFLALIYGRMGRDWQQRRLRGWQRV